MLWIFIVRKVRENILERQEQALPQGLMELGAGG